MKKKTYCNIDLTCSFQQVEDLENNQCLSGVFSKADNGFRFEESVRRQHNRRNPKLFDGKYCSLVHMQNGKYRIHMKTIDASTVADRQLLAYEVYAEVLKAFNVID